MSRRSLLTWVYIISTALSVAHAKEPAFDCAKAQGEVERLICGNEALAALDRKLDDIYRSAAVKARGKLATQLRAEQRGWVKGRNECWKADGQRTWITASWTVDTVAGCVEAQYRLRISELQAVWRILPPLTMVATCQNQPANELVINQFDTDPATLRLERGDRTVTLWQVGQPERALFEGQNVSLVRKDRAVAVNWLDTSTGMADELHCMVR